MEKEDVEPPVPAGLKKLTTAQVAFVDYLEIDDDLITAAAENSPPGEASPEGFEAWVGGLPGAEKDAMLLSLLNGSDPHLGVKLRKRFADSMGGVKLPDASPRRTVADLLAAAQAPSAKRREHQKQLAEKARAKKQADDAIKRAAYLDDLAKREPQAWTQVETLIATKLAKNYDDAVLLLRDLRDLANRDGSTQTFVTRLLGLQERHSQKPRLIKRIRQAGLVGNLK